MDCVSYVGVSLVGREENFLKGSGGDTELEQYIVDFYPNAVFIYAELAWFRA